MSLKILVKWLIADLVEQRERKKRDLLLVGNCYKSLDLARPTDYSMVTLTLRKGKLEAVTEYDSRIVKLFSTVW